MLKRYLSRRLPLGPPPRRLVVLTGARQVGKTTLARAAYEAGLRYLNLDSPGERQRLRPVSAEAWGRVVGEAVLDEVQKAPDLLEKIKWAFDEGEIGFSVLLGSSRILLLDKVKESLAGRVFLYELWPLTCGELAPHFGGGLPDVPLIVRLMEPGVDMASVLGPFEDGVAGREPAAAQAALQHLLDWGGMPSLLELPPEERFTWLDSYQATYLERDLSDLARLRDLEPFVTCHRLAALRAGNILSYSELARDAGLPVTTVRRYLRYLGLSYQTMLLPAWSRNLGVRLVKAPKLLWVDAGVQRVLSGQEGGLTGSQYESFIISQILTTLWTLGVRVRASYLRTSGGLEVDLLLETAAGVLALEVKTARRPAASMARPIERVRRLLGDRYLGGLVVCRCDTVTRLSETVYAVADWMLLGMDAHRS